MNNFVNTLSHVGDIAAILFFAWAAAYFYRKKHRTLEEKILMALAVFGILVDLFFTFHYLRK
jgi:hypothetical protein